MKWLVVMVVAVASIGVPPASAADQFLDVQLRDQGCPGGPGRFCITPDSLAVDEGSDLVLRVTNVGRVAHNLTFVGGTPPDLAEHSIGRGLAVNESVTLSIPWRDFEEALGEEETATFQLQCGVRGHAVLGMRAELQVNPPGADEAARPQPGPSWLVALLAVAGAAMLRRD